MSWVFLQVLDENIPFESLFLSPKYKVSAECLDMEKEMPKQFPIPNDVVGREGAGAGGVSLDPWLHDARARRLRSAVMAEGARWTWANMRRLIAAVINRSALRVGNLLRRSLLERHARRHLRRPSLLGRYVGQRRRRSAIARLKALDDRLLADIGLRRSEIELAVDRKLARRDDGLSRPVARYRSTDERRHELPKAA
jgi:uncharacterized protein YjiS (DUF1127 family)